MRPIRPPIRLPLAPTRADALLSWAVALTKELQTFINESSLTTPDHLLLGRVSVDVLTDGFTITPKEFVCNVSSLAAVTSDAVAAIKKAAIPQLLVIQNVGAFYVTIKNGAQTNFAAGVDVALGPGISLLLFWTGVTWIDSNSSLGITGHVLPGSVSAWPVGPVPPGWLVCDGSSYLRSAYPILFAIIGTTYGAVDGSHFNVPNTGFRLWKLVPYDTPIPSDMVWIIKY